ncbi:MAG: hypothetical protein HN778_17215 [Prolixibacteraceae bacterium]|jgi:hypothetical protein|nr:hypothetical protein [Prolixibacteraceae bacterium]MBT6004313.1 hypothetical protein [Prolixibacteraceae bacterium]MBT6765102.1 hypothetical protein [Prolixibacteraceae bacterium]MBT6999875.1 hypothetical protein [Prolixibacteraceae bacterium]MBT7396570.1 hypothetical protein [Prolixibacteraceae bacterium]
MKIDFNYSHEKELKEDLKNIEKLRCWMIDSANKEIDPEDDCLKHLNTVAQCQLLLNYLIIDIKNAEEAEKSTLPE